MVSEVHPLLARRHSEMLESYGFGLPFAPQGYRTGRSGAWELRGRLGCVSESYIAQGCVEPPFHVLAREGDVWMATSMLETESHAWHLSRATGDVVAAGFGMGLFAHAAAAKPDVRRVVVAEVCPELMVLAREAMPALSPKVEVLLMDAGSAGFAAAVRDRLAGGRPDYLYADIWPIYPDPEAPGWTRALVEALDPREAGWWGQEAALAQRCDEDGLPVDLASAEAFMAERGIPCLLDAGYVEFCRDVAKAHGLNPDGVRPAP